MENRNYTIYQYAMNGHKYHEIADIFGISQPRVSQIVTHQKEKEVRKLTKQERNKVIKLRYKQGKSYAKIAKEFGISNGRVWQIVNDWDKPKRNYDAELVNSTKRPKAHPLNDSPWVWLAVPALLVAWLVISWVLSLV